MNHLADEFYLLFCLQTICPQIVISANVSIIWSSIVDNHLRV